jgi:hypothetical protein
VTQTAGITMKDKKAHYNVCNKCGEKGRFLDRGTWWCAWENRGGAYNLVGACKNTLPSGVILKHERKNENNNT